MRRIANLLMTVRVRLQLFLNILFFEYYFYGRVTEWLKVTDCKSVGNSLRRFESYFSHKNDLFLELLFIKMFLGWWLIMEDTTEYKISASSSVSLDMKNFNIIPFENLCFLFSEFFIIFFILFALILGLTFMKKEKEYLVNSFFIRYSAINLIFVFLLLWNLPFNTVFLFNGLILVDSFSIITKLFIVFLTFIFLFISLDYLMSFHINKYEFFIFIFLGVLGLFFLISANDLLILYLALELQSLTFYLMVALKKDSPFAAEASLKYFILGAIFSGLLLFGISLIYGFTGTTNFFVLYCLFLDVSNSFYIQDLFWTLSFTAFLGFALIIFAFFFKLTAAPFHVWSPDVYEGAPMVVSIFLAVIPKIGVFAAFVRLVFFVFYEIFPLYDSLLTFVIIISFIISTFNSLQQKKLKRFFAYTSISHIAFILIGINSLNLMGFIASYFYLFCYSIMNFLVWVILLSLKRSDRNSYFTYMNSLTNLGKTNPVLAFCFSFVLLSMAGIPPLIGFATKFWILVSGVQSHQYVALFVAILSSVLSCFYYLRLIKIMFFEKSSVKHTILQVKKEHSIVISIFTFSLFFLFFFADAFISYLYVLYFEYIV